MTCATLSFLRVGGVVMEAPWRQSAFWAKKYFLVFWAQKVQNMVRNEEMSKIALLRHGAKRHVNVTVFGSLWRPEMQKMSFGAKQPLFRILGPKCGNTLKVPNGALLNTLPPFCPPPHPPASPAGQLQSQPRPQRLASSGRG